MKQRIKISSKPCSEWLKKMNAFHPDDLSPEEWAQLSKHLESCVQCRAAKAEYTTINALILGLPRARPLPALPARLQDLMGMQSETGQPLPGETLENDDSLQTLHIPTHARSPKAQSDDSRLISRLNLVATMLVVVALLGGLLLLLSTRHPGSVDTANTTTISNFTRLYLVTTGPDGQTNKLLSALNPGNGHVIWQQKLDSALDGYGLSRQGNLYLPALDGNVYAFMSSNGQPLWHTTMSHGQSGFTGVSLLAYQNLIIDSITNSNNGNGDLYALNEQTGAVIWHTSISCAASPSNDCAAGGRLMLLANGIIYGLADDGLSAWNAANGQFLWRNPHYQLNGQPQSMVVSHSKVYITNFYPEVDVLDAGSGRFLHSLRPPEPNNSGAVVYDIAASENIVYVLGGQTVSAYWASDDSLLWKQPFSYHSGGTIYASGSGVYVNYYDITMGKIGTGNSGPNLYALRPGDGHLIWHHQIPLDTNYLYPVEFNGVICFGGLHSVYGLRVSDGKQLWQVSNGEYLDSLFGG
jgi:outer membrane protein assembly factor BamB